MSKFRENLKQELTYKDMRVKELSEITGISKHTIDHYLAENSSEPLAEAAIKIAQALGVSVEYLVIGHDKSVSPSVRESVVSLVKDLNRLSDEALSHVQFIVRSMAGQ